MHLNINGIIKAVNNVSSKNLIFLISQPRAGSTMLQLILSAYPDIATTSEPWIALHPFFALKEHGIDARYNAILAREALKEFLTQSGSDETFYKEQVSHFLNTFYQKAMKHQGKKYFLDKTPRYYLIIDELMETFSDARFIFLVRHPLAVLNSIMKTWVKDDYKRLGLFKDDLLLAPRLIVDACKRYSDRSYVLKYEDFVSNPENVLGKICDYIGVDYSDDMLDYGKRRPDWKFGDPVGIHKSSRPSADSLRSWEKGFESEQLNLLLYSYLEDLGEGLIETMGYDYKDIISNIPRSLDKKTGDLISWADTMKYDHLEYERDLLRKERDAILNSLSWKITAPLRRFFRFIKGL